MEKIVTRPVYDDVVRERLKGDGDAYRDYFERVPVYQKDVTVTLPRIELLRSSGGLVQKEANCTFKAILQQLLQTGNENLLCELQWAVDEDRVLTFNMDYKSARILKALAIAQVNMCKEFTDVMGYIFMQLAKSIVAKKAVEWKPDVNFSVMQGKLFDSTTKYIANIMNKEV